MPTLTIFTPTYNRAHLLPRLFSSLQKQTCKDFLWLVVDDGSVDETERLIQSFISMADFKIDYVKQPNGGKMRAHNKGVKLCITELFVCVDSDDYLKDDAINCILVFWNTNKSNLENICGIVANRGIIDNDADSPRIVTKFPNIRKCTMHSLGRKYGHCGETTIVFRTDIIKKFPFPEIKGEKFITESYVYDMIDQEYEFLLYHDYWVVGKFFEDGYTLNAKSLVFENPYGFALFYNQQLKYWNKEYNFKEKIKILTHYITISKLAKAHNIYTNSNDKSYRYLIGLCLFPFMKYKYTKIFNR